MSMEMSRKGSCFLLEVLQVRQVTSLWRVPPKTEVTRELWLCCGRISSFHELGASLGGVASSRWGSRWASRLVGAGDVPVSWKEVQQLCVKAVQHISQELVGVLLLVPSEPWHHLPYGLGKKNLKNNAQILLYLKQ